MYKEPQLSALDGLHGQLLLGWQGDAILPCSTEGSTAGPPLHSWPEMVAQSCRP